MKESKVEKHLVKRVKAMGGEVRKVKWLGRRGAPDRVVMLPREGGIFTNWNCTIWVELKATNVEPEDHQLREHKRMRDCGQRVVVIDSLAGVEALLSPVGGGS